MELSAVGRQMSGTSGLRSIMDDIATSMAGADSEQWINLSIGNPAPIPDVVSMWRDLTERALQDNFLSRSCQYGPSRGDPLLIDAIVNYFNHYYKWNIDSSNVVIGPGSQMLTFAAAALYAGPREHGETRVILPLVPDYTGYQGLCMYPGGAVGIESPIEKTGNRLFRYILDLPKVDRRADMGLMLLSSPANPTGRSLAVDEVNGLMQIAERRRVPLFIDHAYGEPFPQVCRTLTPPVQHPNVINCFSASKAGLPGERIGFAIGPEPLITPIVSFLANSALHAPRLAQSAIAIGLTSGEIDRVVASAIRPFYEGRRRLALRLLDAAMPPDVNWRLHSGDGGMFCWVWVEEDWFDDLDLYRLLKRAHVFVAPGRIFFTSPAGGPEPGSHATQCFRITLTAPEEALAEGIARIGHVMHEVRRSPPPRSSLAGNRRA
jgi:valine--pyruvate aminotransferase